MARFSVIYDACVLYPAPLRDLLMRLATSDLFQAHWTEDIHQEWITALLRTQKYPREQLEQVKNLMNAHVRDALVIDYQALIPALNLPDPNDRHVLAAAIRCKADAIITFNLKDFPASSLAPYEIEAIHPDEFICYQLDLQPQLVCKAIKQQREALKKPPQTAEQLLLTLQKQQLPQTCARLKAYLEWL